MYKLNKSIQNCYFIKIIIVMANCLFSLSLCFPSFVYFGFTFVFKLLPLANI